MKSSPRPNLFSKIGLYALVALIVFLPFSAWLVSLTGMPAISGIRDVFILLLVIAALINLPKQKPIRLQKVLLWAIGLIVWALLTVFWKEASFEQWLKGFRFLMMPIILFCGVVILAPSLKSSQIIQRAVLSVSALICGLGLVQLLGFELPMTTVWSGAGVLAQEHGVPGINTIRLTSVLAGPNAFGLYLLALVGFVVWTYQAKKRWLWPTLLGITLLMVLTYSRSTTIGLLVMGLMALAIHFSKQFGWRKALSWGGVGLLIIAASLTYLSLKVPKINSLVTHADSSSLRVEQYKRIWQSAGEIGLLGRGVGTAGPASQYRVDGGTNHWTENYYLDLFEELGLVGLGLYLGLLFWVVRQVLQIKTTLSFAALFLLGGFLTSALFINSGTGQVGICLFWVLIGLALAKPEDHTQSL